METKVFLREEKKTVDVDITDEKKPVIKDFIKERWQRVINLVAEILDVPAGLIMKISKTHMGVFLKSQNEDNPYPENGKDHLSHGLYCETVIGKDRPLHIDNALKKDDWSDNPDVKINMISYYGLPLKWSDGTVFGTICALDNQTNSYQKKYRELLDSFKEMIEQDLMILEEKQLLEMQSGKDFLTNIANRRMFLQTAEKYLNEYYETEERFHLVMMDLDGFKHINDHYGHVTGDRILKRFAEVTQTLVCEPCLFARYGGDEFILLMKGKTKKDISGFMEQLKKTIYDDDFLKKYNVDFSYGMALMDDSFSDLESLIEEADRELYKKKK